MEGDEEKEEQNTLLEAGNRATRLVTREDGSTPVGDHDSAHLSWSKCLHSLQGAPTLFGGH